MKTVLTIAAALLLRLTASTPEREFLDGIFSTALQGTPKEPVWEWADQNVHFTQKMAAEVMRFDSSLTPWTRAWQDMVRDPNVHEGVAMKSSQSGYTEASLNVIRWMPSHMPGNVAYVISTDKKAKRISRVRLAETLKQTAAEQLSDDAKDFSTYHMILDNMEITVSGSGSPNPFRETWYRCAFLDEPEDHEELADGTTYSSIKSRFTTVSDSTLFVLGKPQHEGGVIPRGFIKGSQEHWLVPCPRCDEEIDFRFENLKFGHCKDLAGAWDFNQIAEDTHYECQCCHGKIEEWEKRDMVGKGEWVPAAEEDRMKLEGKSVPAELGVRSFHINDIYSSFPGVTWGKLAQKWLSAFVIAPSRKDQDDFRTNHLGLPIEARELTLADTAITNLRGGLVEDQDGKQIVLGHKFSLVYKEHDGLSELVSELIFKPALITVTADKQKECIKYMVFAWTKGGEAYLIDFGSCIDETEFLTLRDRPYPCLLDKENPYYIFGGLIDCRYRPKTVYECCVRALSVGWSLYPARGSGYHSEFRGRNLREAIDYTDAGVPLTIYEFFDHGIKSDFYLGKISRREEPRLWLPDPVPQQVITEWTSEKLIIERTPVGGKKMKWVHDENIGANDYGDCGKMQYVCWQLLAPEILAQ